MMDFFRTDDQDQRTAPEATRITALRAEAYPDGWRLRVNVELTPFQKRPYIDIVLMDADRLEVATTSIVEPLSWRLEFTMHLRGELRNPYTLEARLYYPDGPAAPPESYFFDVTPPVAPS